MWRDPELRARKLRQVKRKLPSCLFTVVSCVGITFQLGRPLLIECQHCHPQSLGDPKSLIFRPGNSTETPTTLECSSGAHFKGRVCPAFSHPAAGNLYKP